MNVRRVKTGVGRILPVLTAWGHFIVAVQADIIWLTTQHAEVNS